MPLHCCTLLLFTLAIALVAPGPALAQSPPLPPAPPGVQVTTEYGIEFSTVGSPGNAAFVPSFIPPPTVDSIYWLERPIGRVDYSYRIARTEVTTAQWMAFANAFSTRTPPAGSGFQFSFFQDAAYPWGATEDPTYSGPGVRYTLRTDIANAGMLPVGGMSWRTAAMYCNWLHNGQSSEWSALTNGAYDISTFGGSTSGFTDQLTHSPGARFWIPTLDEWVKAAHYDPNKNGVGGYWNYAYQSDAPPVYGPPGVGQANSQFHLPNFGQFDIPLASYPDVQSAYGLLDAMGSVAEWTEGWWPYVDPTVTPRDRYVMGSVFGGLSADDWDLIGVSFRVPPDSPASGWGLRVAAAIPSPANGLIMIWFAFTTLNFRRRT